MSDIDPSLLGDQQERVFTETGTVTLESVPEEYHDYLWGMYERSFDELQETTPTIQMMEEDKFKEALLDQEVKKSFRVIDGKPATMLVYAPIQKSPDYFPWNSLKYFEKQFPENYAEGRIYYFVGLFTDPDFRGNDGGFMNLVDHLFRDVMQEHPEGAQFIYDCCENNRDFAKLLHFLAVDYFGDEGAWSVDDLSELGTQTYYSIPMRSKTQD